MDYRDGSKKVLLSLLGASLLSGVIWIILSARDGHSSESARPSSGDRGTVVTILVDFSASFAPYTWADRLTLTRVSEAIVESAAGRWKPPVTVIWRKIGSHGALAEPVCDPIAYTPSLIGGEATADAFASKVSGCVQRVIDLSKNTEPYTDISGAVARAAQSFAEFGGQKILIAFSDFREDLASGVKPAPFQLGGERILMIHRPGIDDNNVRKYIERIRTWCNLLGRRGAGTVSHVAAALLTAQLFDRLLSNAQGPHGVTVIVLLDLKGQSGWALNADNPPGGQLRSLLRGITVFATERASAERPVAVYLGQVTGSALRDRWMPPAVLVPRLVSAPGRISQPHELQLALEEHLAAIVNTTERTTSTDLSGAIALVAFGIQSSYEGVVPAHLPAASANRPPANYLILVSDLADSSPLSLPDVQISLEGFRVVLVYRPSAADVTNAAGFFARIQQWQARLRDLGASVRAIEMATLTDEAIVRAVHE